MRKKYLILLFIFSVFYCVCQNPVNGYANVTAISGTSISVNTVNETYDSFENGGYVVIMQMQDNVIGTNTTNASTFGDVGSILSAGLFEIAQISSHTEAGSIPTSITLANGLSNTYNINANASVQLITFRQFTANYTSTANIGTAAWNGTIGGVTAIWVPGTFTLKHTISADGAGFRGGVKNTPDGYSTCRSGTYIAADNITYYAGKGEGIYKNTNTAWSGARGKIANGGGGGTDTNSGGAGGGNYLSGGDGGSGWVPAGTGCSPSAGGLGGLSLNPYISNARVFMGGGGGGGHENDGVGTAGSNGGGIILLRTNTLVTSACTGVSISSNGVAAVTAANDGAGGGGAGGSIIMQVNAYNVLSTCPLTVSANGGNGGNSNVSGPDAHGGGGGGGQGAIVYPTPQPTLNIITTTIPGNGGISCGSCTSQNAVSGSGTSNTGIVPNAPGGPLPVELLSFNAVINDQNDVLIKWSTAIEKNNNRFILQRMNSNGAITDVTTVKANGNYSTYSYTDLSAENGTNYYRLNQIDQDGSSHLRNWIAVTVSKEPADISIHPNPLRISENLTIECTNLYNQQIKFELMNMLGQIKNSQQLNPSANHSQFEIATDQLQAGIYFVKLTVNGKTKTNKIIITE